MPDKIAAQHSLVRYVPWARLRKDAEDNVIGVLPAAFELRKQTETRPAEEYLSATWLEYFDGDRAERVFVAVRALRESDVKVRPRSGFAIGLVEKIIGGCARWNIKLRVLHEPDAKNKAHAAVRRWPTDNADLCQLMADECWNELVLNKDVPA